MARLVPCLVALRAEFDACFPGRDKASDGWIADAAHSATSDHQPDGRGLVHAIDVDAGLGSPMGDVVKHLVARKDRRLTYIIHARTIWSASHGWRPRPYNGDNPHIEHAHISASDEPALENDTRSFHLEEVPVALTADDKKWLADTIEAKAKEAVTDILAGGEHDDGTPTSRIGRDAWAQGIPNGLKAGTPRDNAWEVVRDLATAVAKLQKQGDEIKAAVVKTPPPAA